MLNYACEAGEAGDGYTASVRLLGGHCAGTPACHGVLDAVTRREALLADAGTTKQERMGSTHTKWTLASDRRRDR